MYEDQVRPEPTAISHDPVPPENVDVAACGFYLVPRPGGIAVHMSVSAEHLHAMRAQVFKAVAGAGADEHLADSARLVASELVANAARLCGPWAPVVVQVATDEVHVTVQVHDPQSAVVPERKAESPDNAQFESGRGLWILDVLAPGWQVEPSPVGKQITCVLPRGKLAAA
ncbi:ATP-binding protein [Kitasatospora sp. NPDC006697]|uniref:ATP-binding protein n=1 Tax=Kitasatospora sp. NPDC006697 TaxID=3364020 RepID=UPI00369136AB